MKEKCTEEMMKKCFNDHDNNGNGYLDYDEYKKLC